MNSVDLKIRFSLWDKLNLFAFYQLKQFIQVGSFFCNSNDTSQDWEFSYISLSEIEENKEDVNKKLKDMCKWTWIQMSLCMWQAEM